MANWLCQLNIKPAKPPIFGKTVGAKKLIFGYLESTKIAQNSGYRENVFFENGFASLTDVWLNELESFLIISNHYFSLA